MKKIVLMVMVFCVVGMVGCGKDEESINNGGTTTVTPGGGTDPGTHPVPDGWVDLGLPSGLLWATCNLGATTPVGYGGHYAWGEVQTKETYYWSNYRYATVYAGNLQTFTKYNTSESYGTVDNKTTLEAMDDAATAALGSGARIPTKDEWWELINNTTVEWTSMNLVNGCKFTASNGNSLFLPATGSVYYDCVNDVGSRGVYGSSSLVESVPTKAWGIGFNSGNRQVNAYLRYYGFSVRAVRSRN